MFLFYTFILILPFYVSPVLYSKVNGNYTQNGVHCKLLFLDNRIFNVFKFTRPLGLHLGSSLDIIIPVGVCVSFFVFHIVVHLHYLYPCKSVPQT